MSDLIVTRLPARQGWWLALQDGSQVRALAKFRGEASMQDFLTWAEQRSGQTMAFKRGDE